MNIPRNDDLIPGTWKGAQLPDSRTALVCCPNGHISSLSAHTIYADGTVSPSVVCPWEGCDFHEYLTLVGWNE